MTSLTAHFKDGKAVLPEQPSHERLSAAVTTVLGMNPGPFSLNGTNTYLVGTGPRRILVDTGQGEDEYIEVLQKAMKDVGCEGLERIIITHWHHDHLGGVPSVQAHFGPDIPVHKYMPQDAEQTTKGEGAVHPFSIWPKEKFIPTADGDTFTTQGATLKAMFTPGHANDHICLFLKEEEALFSADNVLGVGTTVFNDLSLYLNSLESMKASAPKRVYPGHGPCIENGLEAIETYISHRMKRVLQVKEVFRTDPLKEWLPEDITRAIYHDLPPNLIGAATNNVWQVLLKLKDDNFCRESGSEPSLFKMAPAQMKWRLVGDDSSL